MGAPNTNPVYSIVPNVSAAQLTPSITANTKSDGAGTIGTDIVKVWTSGSAGSNAAGSNLKKIRIQPYATVANTATTATIIRLFLSTKTSGVTTAADTWCITEVGMVSQAADHSTNMAYFVDVPVGETIPNGYTILASQHVIAAANTGYQIIAFSGDL